MALWHHQTSSYPIICHFHCIHHSNPGPQHCAILYAIRIFLCVCGILVFDCCYGKFGFIKTPLHVITRTVERKENRTLNYITFTWNIWCRSLHFAAISQSEIKSKSVETIWAYLWDKRARDGRWRDAREICANN